jgi:hypothetical protein
MNATLVGHLPLSLSSQRIDSTAIPYFYPMITRTSGTVRDKAKAMADLVKPELPIATGICVLAG